MDEQEIQAKQQREVKGAEAEAEDVNDDAVNSVGQGSAWPGVIRTATHLSNTADNTSTACMFTFHCSSLMKTMNILIYLHL